MKEWLVVITEHSIVILDTLALLIILAGTLEVAVRAGRAFFAEIPGPERREIWMRYARALIAALTVQLAADIIESAISTNWESIGRLAAIAVIRTFLNYFLERDMAEIRERQHRGPAAIEAKVRDGHGEAKA